VRAAGVPNDDDLADDLVGATRAFLARVVDVAGKLDMNFQLPADPNHPRATTRDRQGQHRYDRRTSGDARYAAWTAMISSTSATTRAWNSAR
jgi:hypothetical protein